MLLGIISYGGYFWTAHAVQQIANDAARTAIGGLDAAERSTLAKSVLDAEVGAYAFLNAGDAVVAVDDKNQTVTVRVAYDATATPFWAFKTIVPMPSSTIHRSATVRLGGY